jgi:ribonuclease BN (tRNA processing enzyme)
VEFLFLSHSHGDHVLGLPSVIGCRNNAQGMSRNEATREHNKPLTIFYPDSNPLHNGFNDLFEFVSKRNPPSWLRYNLTFQPISPGFTRLLSKNLYLRAFEMKHDANQLTLGYVIYENRTRLKKEFVGQNIATLVKQSGFDRSTLSEAYRANLFAYCLDAHEVVEPEQLRDCEEVIMDCTFLKQEDRGTWRLKDEYASCSNKETDALLAAGKKKTDIYDMVPGTDKTHFTLDEAIALCKNVGVKKMHAAHLSSRYDVGDYVLQERSVYDPLINVIDPNKVNHLK